MGHEDAPVLRRRRDRLGPLLRLEGHAFAAMDGAGPSVRIDQRKSYFGSFVEGGGAGSDIRDIVIPGLIRDPAFLPIYGFETAAGPRIKPGVTNVGSIRFPP
jgi:hypothetical protein